MSSSLQTRRRLRQCHPLVWLQGKTAVEKGMPSSRPRQKRVYLAGSVLCAPAAAADSSTVLVAVTSRAASTRAKPLAKR
jgi:hypothetical protein